MLHTCSENFTLRNPETWPKVRTATKTLLVAGNGQHRMGPGFSFVPAVSTCRFRLADVDCMRVDFASGRIQQMREADGSQKRARRTSDQASKTANSRPGRRTPHSCRVQSKACYEHCRHGRLALRIFTMMLCARPGFLLSNLVHGHDS